MPTIPSAALQRLRAKYDAFQEAAYTVVEAMGLNPQEVRIDLASGEVVPQSQTEDRSNGVAEAQPA